MVDSDSDNAPKATTYTAQSHFDQIVAGDNDVDSEYQRDVVWPEGNQIGLIDSIFRNFHIPPVISFPVSIRSTPSGGSTDSRAAVNECHSG
ncbi:hypothetical protein Agabi119p4_10721 [Agaricus bisporus var. burnettii]|uniref:Uncharacterized protein n=1 Tax=Agaricus bisporus var. burnettii TaxID=192524 RepID=A0A8H7C2J5_AGABI|nr:hypothetical protein Agabi119p4_10721 [Agaricus bisporus var. burnettii]